MCAEAGNPPVLLHTPTLQHEYAHGYLAPAHDHSCFIGSQKSRSKTELDSPFAI